MHRVGLLILFQGFNARQRNSQINGDGVDLLFTETEPAAPAYIRNCTKTMMWVLPDDIQLLDKFNKPYIVGGEIVDIRYDGAGGKSKC